MKNEPVDERLKALSDKPAEEPGLESHPLLFQDELTGLYNRRFYNRAYADETLKAAEGKRPLAMLMLDVDYFKTINDRYGHHNGDRLLTQMGRLLNDTVGQEGFPIRYAGDEFAVLMPGATAAQAEDLARRIVEGARTRTFALSDRAVEITVSIGVAHWPDDIPSPRDLFEAADRAAYLAKKGGRNQSARYHTEERRELDPQNLHNYFPCEKFVGREDIVLDLVGALTTAAGKLRPWAIVGGESGIGKTRLLQELAHRMDIQRHFLLEAVGLPHLESQPYAMLLTPISVALRQSTQALSKVAAALNPTEIDAIVTLLPEFKRYHTGASPSLGPASDMPLHTQFISSQTTALCKVIRTLAGGRIPVLVIDDAQQADRQSIAVLATMREQDGNAFACLGVADGVEKSGSMELKTLLSRLRDDPSTINIALKTLTEAHVLEMADAIVPGAQNLRGLGPFLHSRSQGRPLLVEESLKLLIQRRTLRFEDGKLVADDLERANIPKDAQGLLDARAEQADAEVRLLMSHAAVIGVYFDMGMLLQVEEDKNEGWLTAVLERARKANIIKEEWTGVHTRWSFASTQMHVAFYHMSTREQRARVETKVREVRAKQKAQRAAVTAAVQQKPPPAERAAAVDAFRVMAALGVLVAGLTTGLGVAPTVRVGDLFLPWLLLGTGIAAPFAWARHRTLPVSPHTYFDRAMTTALGFIAAGTVIDLLSKGALPFGVGVLQRVGLAGYLAALLVRESTGVRVALALVLLSIHGVLAHLGVAMPARAAEFTLQWLPQIVPAVAIGLAGSVVGSLLASQRRQASWLVTRLAGTGGAAMACGAVLGRWLPNAAPATALPFLLIATGSGLLVFALLQVGLGVRD